MRNILLVSGKIVRPVFTSAQAKGKAFFNGEDTRGEFVACRLDNHWRAQLYGWYILVSPEDVGHVRRYNWCGNICGCKPSQHIEVRRRESIEGVSHSDQLHHDIWERMTGNRPDVIIRTLHPLDFRRQHLALPLRHSTATHELRV